MVGSARRIAQTLITGKGVEPIQGGNVVGRSDFRYYILYIEDDEQGGGKGEKASEDRRKRGKLGGREEGDGRGKREEWGKRREWPQLEHRIEKWIRPSLSALCRLHSSAPRFSPIFRLFSVCVHGTRTLHASGGSTIVAIVSMRPLRPHENYPLLGLMTSYPAQ